MKTYNEWWDTFLENSIIGIDQEDVDQNFNEYTDIQIEQLLSDGLTEYIERNFRQFCQGLIGQYITKPLGMYDTYVTVPATKENRVATVYNEDGKETPHWYLGDMAACGGINSTMDDMLAYTKANYDEKTAVLKRIHQETIKLDDHLSVAYGWHISKMKNGSNIVWHNGGTYGSRSFCGFVPSSGIMIVILSNTAISCDELAMVIVNKLISEQQY